MRQRIGALIQKEFIQIVRDRATLVILLMLPLIQLLVFAFAVHMNVQNIPLAVADQSMDEQSRAYVQALVNTGYFVLKANVADQNAVMRLMDAGQVSAGVVIPTNFSEHIQRGDAAVLALVDGSDIFTSQSANNAIKAIGESFSAKVMTEDLKRAQSGMSAQQVTIPVLNANIRILYNPDLIDLWFIIPGMAAVLLQMQTILLTASAVVREREAGTIEQILVTPIRTLELMIGKMVPNVLIAMFNLLTLLGLGTFVFGVPFQGSIWLFLALSIPYIISGLGLGLLISTVSQNQRQVMQILMMITMVAIILGGFLFPRYTMPAVIQWIGNLFPLTYFIPISRAIISRGAGFAALTGDVLALTAYSIVILFLATRTFRSRLE